MANTGPAPIKITADDAKKFQEILRLPTPAEKTQAQKALSPEENVKFVKYVQLIKAKQEQKKLLEKKAELKADLVDHDARLKDAEARLAALQLEEAALVRKEKAIVTQAANQFAKTLDTFTKPASAKPTVGSTTTAAKVLKI
jgi:hypothetical protein